MKPLSREFLLSRGYCCKLRCCNCPYVPKWGIPLKTVLLDCDGVLCDFVSGALAVHGRSHEGHDSVTSWNFFEVWGMTDSEFYSKTKGYDFWFNLKPYDGAVEFYAELSKLTTPVISTAPVMDPECPQAKINWLYHNFGIIMTNVMVGSQKQLMAKPTTLLIDDSPSNVKKFREAGGQAILFKQPWNDGVHTFGDVLQDVEKFLA